MGKNPRAKRNQRRTLRARTVMRIKARRKKQRLLILRAKMTDKRPGKNRGLRKGRHLRNDGMWRERQKRESFVEDLPQWNYLRRGKVRKMVQILMKTKIHLPRRNQRSRKAQMKKF